MYKERVPERDEMLRMRTKVRPPARRPARHPSCRPLTALSIVPCRAQRKSERVRNEWRELLNWWNVRGRTDFMVTTPRSTAERIS
jgi:hypothetical protein